MMPLCKHVFELATYKTKIKHVKKCIFNHPNRARHLQESIEEHCVSDTDALAHFDCIPPLLSLTYGVLYMRLNEGREYVKRRL